MNRMLISTTADQNQTEINEMEPNPSKDRAMHGEDNPLIWDIFFKFTLKLILQITIYMYL
jgi:hypothetical protein